MGLGSRFSLLFSNVEASTQFAHFQELELLPDKQGDRNNNNVSALSSRIIETETQEQCSLMAIFKRTQTAFDHFPNTMSYD